MLRRTLGLALAVTMTAAMTSLTGATAIAGGEPPGTHSGPPYNDFKTELIGGVIVPLPDLGVLTRTKHGYRYESGPQNSRTTVTLVNGRLRFVDRATKRLKKVAPQCRRVKVRKGVGATCRVPAGISVRSPLLIEIWPRMGNDHSDTSTLPATMSVSVLSDAGSDVAHFGAGRDFFNGHQGRDRVWGGPGNDWFRGGLNSDTIRGGRGNDDIVAMEAHDVIRGGRGNDRLWGSGGNDRVIGGPGADLVICGTGRDAAAVDRVDRVFADCETVHRS